MGLYFIIGIDYKYTQGLLGLATTSSFELLRIIITKEQEEHYLTTINKFTVARPSFPAPELGGSTESFCIG